MLSMAFYAVRRGRAPGVYQSWAECEAQVRGFSRASFKRFSTQAAADAFMHEERPPSPKRARALPRWADGATTSEEGGETAVLRNRRDSSSSQRSAGTLSGPAYVPMDPAKKSPYEDDDCFVVSETGGTSGARAGEAPEAEVVLTPEQLRAVDAVIRGENVFITGSGGTGKSLVLRQILRKLRAKHSDPRAVGVCATTGIAAENVNGCTIHSLLGLGVPVRRSDFRKISSSRHEERLQCLRVVIIDEVSMMSGEMLDLIEAQLRVLKESVRPFGGIQMVFSGDFYQLPPVRRRDAPSGEDIFTNAGYAFQSRAWLRGNIKCIDLQLVLRQDSQAFIEALSDLRVGLLSERAKTLVASVRRPVEVTDGIVPTVLFCHNRDVTSYNVEKLDSIDSEKKVFKASDEVLAEGMYTLTEARRLFLRRHSFWDTCRAKQDVALKVGAQVMLLSNMSQNESCYLINGSRGVVTSFAACSGYPVVLFRNKAEEEIKPTNFDMVLPGVGICRRNQVPLMLAWALSVHKSQGLSIDRLKVDLSGVFERGQTYVALSRARFVETLEVTALPRGAPLVQRNPAVDDFVEDVKEGSYFRTVAWSAQHSPETTSPAKRNPSGPTSEVVHHVAGTRNPQEDPPDKSVPFQRQST